MKKTHKLRVETEVYVAIRDGLRTFEIRPDETDIRVGDRIRICEYIQDKATGRECWGDVTYILRNVAPYQPLRPGYICISIRVSPSRIPL